MGAQKIHTANTVTETNTKTLCRYLLQSWRNTQTHSHSHTHTHRPHFIQIRILVLRCSGCFVSFFCLCSLYTGCELPSHSILRTFSLGHKNSHKRRRFQHESRAYTIKWGYSFLVMLSPTDSFFPLLLLLFHRPLACVRFARYTFFLLLLVLCAPMRFFFSDSLLFSFLFFAHVRLLCSMF